MHTNWTFKPSGSTVVTAPIVVNGNVIVGSAAGSVYALSESTGSQLWTDKPGSAINPSSETSSLAAGEGLLAVPVGASIVAYTGTAAAGATAVASLALDPNSTALSVGSGVSQTATVSLSKNATAGGMAIALSSTYPSAVGVPVTVTVAANSSTASFPIKVQTGTPVTATITATVGGGSKAVSLTALPLEPLRFDFAADGHSDLVWENSITGQVQFWYLNDQTVLQHTESFGQVAPSTGWSIVGSPDVNGDGKADLLWYNSINGNLCVWTMNGAQILYAGAPFAQAAPSTGWLPVAVGDVTSDGHWSLIWQNTSTGGLLRWHMQGTAIGDVVAFGHVDPNSGWRIVAFRDFDGDGHDDLLWENSKTGGVLRWLMNDTTLLNAGAPFATVAPGTGWRIAGAPDMNSDGYADILWFNATSGACCRWLMKDTTVLQSGSVFAQMTPSTGWQVKGMR